MSDGMGRELAYLSSHATNRYFIPNWGTTGIQASTADKKQQAKVLGIYDLTGRRVSDMNAGGIYIVRTNQGNFKVKK